MTKIISKTNLALFSIFIFLFYSCVHDPGTTEVNNSDFDYKTTQEIDVSVSTLNSKNNPVEGVVVQIYTQNPLTTEGLLKDNSSDFLLFKGISSNSGTIDCKIAPQTSVDSLSILVNHIGFPSLYKVKIDSNNMNVVVGGSQNVNRTSTTLRTNSTAGIPDPIKISGYYVLGGWDNQGKPNYLENPDDVIDNAFLADINASLPEQIRLPISHPEYINSTDDGNIELVADAEVYVTFVHEGAGYRNAIGYYTNNSNNPPLSKADIINPTIIFPNVSYNGSGGSLRSGNKVQLLYLNPVTNKYTKTFPAGTTVSWFLIANSFNGSTNSIGSGAAKYYSDKRFNPETNINKKKHNVILKDVQRQLLIIGFEDLNREGGSDEDFNDAIFYSTVFPFSAAKVDKIKEIDKPQDTDGDGVSDLLDEYPNDSDKAFNNYYPSKNNVGTLAYEDLWPNRGDYDFNDLVVNYNFNQISNASNKVVEVNAAITVSAIGASAKNAFSLQFNTAPNNVKSVTGQNLFENLFLLNANRTEQNQSKAVVPIFDNSFKVLNYNGSIVNTIVGGLYVTPKTINVKIEFVTPISLSTFGTAPYNPFVVVGGNRGKEIHLAASEPTDLADKSIFGTEDDNTNLALQKYYMSNKYLPWAINIPVKFAYPAEKQDITKAYLLFNRWATSRGLNYKDWYLDKPGYRDLTKLFNK